MFSMADVVVLAATIALVGIFALVVLDPALTAVARAVVHPPTRRARDAGRRAAAPVSEALSASGVAASDSGLDRASGLLFVDIPDRTQAARVVGDAIRDGAPALWEEIGTKSGPTSRISWAKAHTQAVAEVMLRT